VEYDVEGGAVHCGLRVLDGGAPAHYLGLHHLGRDRPLGDHAPVSIGVRLGLLIGCLGALTTAAWVGGWAVLLTRQNERLDGTPTVPTHKKSSLGAEGTDTRS
jgi:hypothetical protein